MRLSTSCELWRKLRPGIFLSLFQPIRCITLYGPDYARTSIWSEDSYYPPRSVAWHPLLMTYFLRVPVQMKPLRIGILGFDGMAMLDLAGPLEALTAARPGSGDGGLHPGYEIVLIGVTGKTFTTESSVILKT